MKLLMVCLGNICRSPLAEGIMKRKLLDKGLVASVDSAGTGDWHQGQKPDHRSILIAKENGIDISNQIARGFINSDFEQFDLIFVMDNENYHTLLDRASTNLHKSKIKLILSVLNSPSITEVPDPYYGTLDDFRNVYNLLDRACEAFVSTLTQKEEKS